VNVELFQHILYLFNSWQREILAMEGKSVLPMPIGPFVVKEEVYLKIPKGPG
jgi:hypothetical protein